MLTAAPLLLGLVLAAQSADYSNYTRPSDPGDAKKLQSHLDVFKGLFEARDDPATIQQWQDLVTAEELVAEDAKPELADRLVVKEVTVVHADTVTEYLKTSTTPTESVVEATTAETAMEPDFEANGIPKAAASEDRGGEPGGSSARSILNAKKPSYKLSVAPQFKSHSRDGVQAGDATYAKPKTLPNLLNTNFAAGKVDSFEDDEYVYSYVYEEAPELELLTISVPEEIRDRQLSTMATPATSTAATTTRAPVATTSASTIYASLLMLENVTHRNLTATTTVKTTTPGSATRYRNHASGIRDFKQGEEKPRARNHPKKHEFRFFNRFQSGASQADTCMASLFAAIIFVGCSVLLL
ncbi:hypothetical protein ABC855_g2667 [[Candida] zeylanoides]